MFYLLIIIAIWVINVLLSRVYIIPVLFLVIMKMYCTCYFFSIAVIKYSHKSSPRKEGFTLNLLKEQSIMKRKAWWQV